MIRKLFSLDILVGRVYLSNSKFFMANRRLVNND